MELPDAFLPDLPADLQELFRTAPVFRLLGIGVLINIPGTEIEENGKEKSQRRQERNFQKVRSYNLVEKNPACQIPQEPGFPLQMGDLFPNLLFHQNPPPSRAFMSPRSFRRNRSCAAS